MGETMSGVFWFFLLFPVLLVSLSFDSSADLEINEVMYAPSSLLGSENEWIEFYNEGNESFDLSNCTLDGKAVVKTVIDANQYLVLANNLLLFNTSYPSVVALKQTLNLNNDQDTIVLRCEFNNRTSSLEKEFSYNDDQGGYRNNFTLERRSDDTWSESAVELGTPGRENSIWSLASDYKGLEISEILPDPFWEDNLLKPEGEWIELYNGGKKTIYLKGLVFKDAHDENELYIVDSKLLASEGMFLHPGSYAVIYRDGDSDFTLNNEGFESVRLFKEEEIIDEVSYSGSTSGMSWSKVEGHFYLSPPTPGKANKLSEGCDWLLLLNSTNAIYQNKDFSFDVYISRFLGLPGLVTVKGRIENAFGETIREYSPWTNVLIDNERGVSYSPHLPEGIYQIIFWIDQLECNDTDEMDNEVRRIMVINQQYQIFDSSLAIEEVYLGSDEKAKWGELFLVKINAYKGNSTKTAVELWAEKEGTTLSKRSKVNVYERFQNYTVTLPLQLDGDCSGRGETVDLVLSGLDREVRTSFTIEGVEDSQCQTVTETKSTTKTKSKKSSFTLVDLPATTFPGQVLPITVQIENTGSTRQDYTAWAYLYRGSKCYSCASGQERDANQREVRVEEKEAKKVTLYAELEDSLEPGEYKVKVKVQQEGQKTVKEITETIYVLPQQEESEAQQLLAGTSFAGGLGNKSGMGQVSSRQAWLMNGKKEAQGFVVYQSSSAKSMDLLPAILIITLVLVGIVVVVNR